jgi:hypothetical protein
MFGSLIAALALAGVAAAVSGPVAARPYSHHHHVVPGEANLVSHRHYTNVSGQWVHSPSKTRDGRAPAGWTAHCSDGSYSFSEHHRGTCSHHGGVATWR